MKTKASSSSDSAAAAKTPLRYERLSELMGHFERCLSLKPRKTWDAIMGQFERLPWKHDDGCPAPCFGGLRFAVRKRLSAFVDYAVERERWAWVQTREGWREGLQRRWSDLISAAFHEHCVREWGLAFHEILLAVRDMLLFRCGIFGWLDGGLYPRSLETGHVWPDREAGMTPDEFNIVHICRRMSAAELHRAASTAEGRSMGWSKDAVAFLLKRECHSVKDDSHDSIFLKFASGGVPQDEADRSIDIVYSLITELDGSLTLRIWPASGSSLGKKDKAAQDGIGPLCVREKAAAKASHLLQIVSSDPLRKYHEGKSFAELVYTVHKTYDLVTFRVLQAIEDNMRVYYKTSSQQHFERMKKMRHDQHVLLPPGTDIETQRVQRPVADAMSVLRSLMSDQQEGAGQYSVSGESSQPKTARQSEIDFGMETAIQSAEVKVFNAYFTGLVAELYRRFASTPESSPHRPAFKRFKEFLDHHGVPESAWAFENVRVSSLVSPGAGSPAARVQAARTTLEALSVPAGSPGERRAQRDLIAAVQGIEHVDSYIPQDEAMTVPEDSLIGLENDALSTPDANPKGLAVHPQHLHFRHVPMHIEDSKLSLEAAFKLMGSLDSFGQDKGVILKTIQDMLIGVDNKLAHARAHLQVASRSRDKGRQARIKQFEQAIAGLNRAQDQLEQQLNEALQARAQEQPAQEPPEVAHKRTMYQLEEEHTARMLAFDSQKQQSKAEQLRQQSAANTVHKQRLETYKAASEVRRGVMRTASEIQNEKAKASSSNGSSGPQE